MIKTTIEFRKSGRIIHRSFKTRQDAFAHFSSLKGSLIFAYFDDGTFALFIGEEMESKEQRKKNND